MSDPIERGSLVSPPRRVFLVEIWSESRPYVVQIGKNLLVTATLWVALFLSAALRAYLILKEPFSTYFGHLEGIGAIIVLVIFLALSVLDIWYLAARRTDRDAPPARSV